MKKILFIALLSTALLPVAAQEVVDLSGEGPGVKEISVTNEGFDYIPGEIRVKKGDTVKAGTMIGEGAGLISSVVHASISGTVK